MTTFKSVMNDDLQQTPNFYDQSFGVDVLSLSDDLQPLVTRMELCRLHEAEEAAKKNAALHVNLDVQQFRPDELTVRATDGSLTIEGKHEEHEDEHGLISRHFQRRYSLPDEACLDNVQCKLSSDGILSLTVPKEGAGAEHVKINERLVPIIKSVVPAVRDAAHMPLSSSACPREVPDGYSSHCTCM